MPATPKDSTQYADGIENISAQQAVSMVMLPTQQALLLGGEFAVAGWCVRLLLLPCGVHLSSYYSTWSIHWLL